MGLLDPYSLISGKREIHRLRPRTILFRGTAIILKTSHDTTYDLKETSGRQSMIIQFNYGEKGKPIILLLEIQKNNSSFKNTEKLFFQRYRSVHASGIKK